MGIPLLIKNSTYVLALFIDSERQVLYSRPSASFDLVRLDSVTEARPTSSQSGAAALRYFLIEGAGSSMTPLARANFSCTVLYRTTQKNS